MFLLLSYFSAVEAFKDCYSKVQYILETHEEIDTTNPLLNLAVPILLHKKQKQRSSRIEDALKLLNMINLNISRTLELAGYYFFTEVTSRAMFYDTEDAQFNTTDEMIEFVKNYYNFIKEKVNQQSHSIVTMW